MRHHPLIPIVTGAALLAFPVYGLELIASSFGGCGNSGSASYATAGTIDPSGGRPVGSASSTVCPGPMATEYRPVLAGTPRAHLLPTGPGTATLVAVPDVPGWSWSESTDLAGWSPVAGGDANPLLVPTKGPRRYFRLEQP